VCEAPHDRAREFHPGLPQILNQLPGPSPPLTEEHMERLQLRITLKDMASTSRDLRVLAMVLTDEVYIKPTGQMAGELCQRLRHMKLFSDLPPTLPRIYLLYPHTPLCRRTQITIRRHLNADIVWIICQHAVGPRGIGAVDFTKHGNFKIRHMGLLKRGPPNRIRRLYHTIRRLGTTTTLEMWHMELLDEGPPNRI
jgi:hypothetical protein